MVNFSVAILTYAMLSLGLHMLSYIHTSCLEYISSKMNLYRLKDNPQYTYAYQVAAEDEQTYIAHQEQRDGTDVSI